MRTILVVGLAGALGLTLSACGNDGSDTNVSGAGSESAGTETAGTATAGTDSGSASNTATMSGSGGSGGSTTGDSAGSGGSTGADPGPGVDLQCGGVGGAAPGDGVICFYDVENMDLEPAANVEYELVDLGGQPAIYVTLIFAPWFADNTYGINEIGWPDDKHTFNDLVGSDHAEIVMSNAAGDIVLDFELDYIDEDDTAPSGYRCMGVWDGNGKMNEGDPASILAANSSLSRNLNERGYGTYVEDSPATDENYTPNPATPQWDYRIIYEVWIDAALFTEDGENAFTEACVQSIHASPSKAEDNTKDVIPDECPPGWGCYQEDGCTECDPGEIPDPDAGADACDPTEGFPPVP